MRDTMPGVRLGEVTLGETIIPWRAEVYPEESIAAYCDHCWPRVLAQRSPPFCNPGVSVWRPLGFLWTEDTPTSYDAHLIFRADA